MRPASFRPLCCALAVTACLCLPEQTRAGVFYLALGDSDTFGSDPSTPSSLVPSFGDQGFVRPFADALAGMNGGVRPGVLNLGIPGELSTSFFSGNPPLGWIRRQERNLNYPTAITPQNALMLSSIAAIHGAGDSVGFVTFRIGANDLSYLVSTPEFQSATPAQQQAMIVATMTTVLSNYGALLTELTTMAPEATILLPNYQNPFPVSFPQHDFYEAILAAFNPAVQSYASAFGARYVDVKPLFAGREFELTNLAIGDNHMNQAGYAVVAGALAQAVPEPGSILMLGVGVLGLLGHRWRHRQRRQHLAPKLRSGVPGLRPS